MIKKKATKRPQKPAKKVTVRGALPSLELSMPLDAKRIEAIQKCLQKRGTLRIRVSKVDLAAGKVGDPWIYD